MGLTKKQRGVMGGMLSALGVGVVLVGAGMVWNPLGLTPGLDFAGRVQVAAGSWLILLVSLAVAIGRLAKHRFLTPEDIDGAAGGAGSARARILQSLLQNTLEQATLAGGIYLCWSVWMPPQWLSVPPVAAIVFGVGRILFFVGYEKGAPARAFGFALAFYPSIVMLALLIVYLLVLG